ncbi:hypothetical protein KITKAT_19 [Arthrobacter phage Kitkat]|uniref:Uncharacterized protein n=3 Tax=Kelleziovirus TaxID=1982236 RepID=A0A140G6A3_9CAUD|nr:hypothetical protein BJD78_gp18 [Arthrobacter phage KellEzio]YP_009303302.1 hypothetical protein BJD77_gp019 [Arthrobacter phage Kitkat]AMM44188.1 hypothetical protein KELLEZIO_18 [Arthrobacter phage KellEzio]AMM44281.1 hypothetical protein KITKAT_19 [Arthrobacter phage Kitkat]QGJ96457.1 hypothetical protein SEA_BEATUSCOMEDENTI_18 [Arthrobacter phage BeatusComedenti]
MATKAERIAEIMIRREQAKHVSADYRWGFRAEDAFTITAIAPYRRTDGIYLKENQQYTFHIDFGDLTSQLASIETAVAGIEPEWDLTPRRVIRRG